jgi:hypothetical protein
VHVSRYESNRESEQNIYVILGATSTRSGSYIVSVASLNF